MPVPDGYVRVAVRGVQAIAREASLDVIRSALEAAGSLHAWAASRPDARPLEGRGTAYRVAGGAQDWVVRHYQRGGAVARFLGDRYLRLSGARPFDELAVSAVARARGIRTPVVVAATVHPAGPFYRGDIATLHIPDAADLAGVCFGASRWPKHDRIGAWRAAGQLVRAAAEAGLRHADVNLKNIPISHSPAPATAWLLDLDRARIGSRPDRAARATMVARLHRSRRKLEARHGEAVDDAALHAFAEALRA